MHNLQRYLWPLKFQFSSLDLNLENKLSLSFLLFLKLSEEYAKTLSDK